MLKNILIIALSVATAAVFTANASAEEMTSPSYMAKKQGRVPFASTQNETAATSEEPTAQSVQAIEPAAGAEDDMMEQDTSKSALEQNMRLPRKN